jgi:hypothetical protein
MTSGAERPAGEDGLTSGARMSARAGDWAAYLFGKIPGGPWAVSAVGPKSSPRPFILFLFLSDFSFSVFPISSISFAIFIQTKSNKFLNHSTTQVVF